MVSTPSLDEEDHKVLAKVWRPTKSRTKSERRIGIFPRKTKNVFGR